jgi:hypothetical protein
MADRTEIRFEAVTAELAVMDGYCAATGKTRTDVLRALLADWSRERLHEATLICRVAGVNPMAPDSGRQGGGE